MIHSVTPSVSSSQGVGSDALSSHWEARVLQGSIMAALLVEPSLIRIDPITLAALQDTGWYSVNFSRAQSLVWGEGKTSAIKLDWWFTYMKRHHALVNAGVSQTSDLPVRCFTTLAVCFCVCFR